MDGKSFFDTFPTLKVRDDLSDKFSEVTVDRVYSTKRHDRLRIHIKSEHIIDKSDIISMEKQIKEKLFPDSSIDISIREDFELKKEYSPKDLFGEYSESMLLELKTVSPIMYTMFKNADISFSDDDMNITVDKLPPYMSKEEELKEYIKHAFTERCGVFVNAIIDYKESENEDDGQNSLDEIKIQRRIERISQNVYNVENGVEAEEETSLGDKGEEIEVPDTIAKPHNDKNGKNKKKKSLNPDIIWGTKTIEGETVPISTIVEEMGKVIVKGQAYSFEEKMIVKLGKYVASFIITDFEDSIMVKMFIPEDELEDFKKGLFSKDGFVKIEGSALFDSFAHEVVIQRVNTVELINDFRVKRVDDYPEKRVELHCHTKMSDTDGVSDVGDIVKRAYKWGHKAIAITDHGVVHALADANHTWESLYGGYKSACKENGETPNERQDFFKVILGVEGYLVDNTREMFVNGEGHTFDENFVVFDIETTGFSPENNRIIEIGAVKVEGGKITDAFSEFVNPGVHIPPRITELTSITDQMVKDAKGIEEVLPAFLDFSKDCILVAHNAKFDMGFIYENCERLGLKCTDTYGDTMLMSRYLFPKQAKHDLDTLVKNMNVTLSHHHRAVDDAKATADIFVKFIPMLKERCSGNLDELTKALIDDKESIKRLRMSHIVILAKNETGRVNLYRLITESHLNYFSRRPRIPKSLLEKYREGLLLGSACCAGEVFDLVVSGGSKRELLRTASFYDYLEIQPIANNAFMLTKEKRDGSKAYEDIKTEEDLRDLNRKIVKLGEELHKPVCATCDVHFLDPEDEIYRTIITVNRDSDKEEPAPLFLRTTEEMLEEFSYLGADKAREVVITNTNLVADAIESISPVRPDKSPPIIQDSDKELRRICEEKAHQIYGEVLPPIVEARMEKELNSIISNGFAVMYIIAQKLVWKSVEDGYLVGSRGSVGSSFVAYLAGITEVNSLSPHYLCPNCHFTDFDSEEVKKYSGMAGFDMPDRICPNCGTQLKKDGYDIPFETFLGFKGDKEPDIDLNFSSEYQSKAHKYTEVIFGKGQTFKAGTISTLKDKNAFGLVKKYFEKTGQAKRRCEMDRLIKGCVGVWNSTGQHPGGIVVLPKGEEINTFTPVQHPANKDVDIITTHFDYHKIDHNLLKLDILGHADPTMIRRLQDTTGVDPVTIPLDDKKVMSLFQSPEVMGITPEDIGGCPTGTLGIPEFGTKFVIDMLVDTKPQCLTDLIRISGLSHGTDVWLNNAQVVIEEGKATISTAICTRDDIMVYLISMGMDESKSFKIMEAIRKGKVAKGACAEWNEWKQDMIDHGVPEWYIWSAEKIQYMFPKAHAAAYVMMGWRVAYYKIYYPLDYYSAYFSIRAKGFDYKKMCTGVDNMLASLKQLQYRMDHEKDEGVEPLTSTEKETIEDLKLVREMYARGYEFLPIDLYQAHATRFKVIDGKIMPSFSSIQGMGEVAAISLMEAAAEGPFLSKDNIRERTKVSKTILDAMDEMGLLGDIPETNQISLFDF